MLKNYLTVAIRHYRHHAFYSSLNILGLSIGYAACLLIGMYLQFETSFESFHRHADRIYRPTHHFVSGSGYDVHWARLSFDYINELPNELPEVEHLIRFQNQERKYVRIGQEKFKPEHSYITDVEVFEVFDFPLVAGNPATALAEPYSVVLTESLAATYFGKEDPMGQELFITGEYSDEEVRYTITGVMRDLPANTHLPVDMLISFREASERRWWAYVYVLLAEGAKIEDLSAKMPEFIRKYSPENQAGEMSIEFQALTDIHLHSHLAREIVPNGNDLYVKIFFFVGLFLLLIAMINYLNLSSALSLGRSREVGMRFILGAPKGQLMLFALVESVIYNLVAAMISFLLVLVLLPSLQSIVGVELSLSPVLLAGGIGLVAIICGLLAGMYPAYILTSFSALKMIRHSSNFSLRGGSSSFWFKRILVGLQFCASILLLSSAWVARNQMVYLQEKELGLTTDQILAITSVPNPVTDGYPSFRSRIQTIPGVKQITACMEVPSREIRDVGPTYVQGRTTDPNNVPMLDMQVISPGFIETMGIEVLAGEDRSDAYVFQAPPQFSDTLSPTDYLNNEPRSYMINETAMRELGWQDPKEAVGQQIRWSIGGFELATGPITAVVKDFHQESLKNQVDPTIMVVEQIWLRTFLLKVNTQNLPQTMREVQDIWDEMFPNYPLAYHFLDELYNQLYQQDRRQMQLMVLFSGLAIFIAVLGLFSLVAFSLKTRVKEMSIRKVLGAEMKDLVGLISKEYIWVLLIGGVFAIPLSILWVQGWLTNFAYKIEISPLPYIWTMALIVLMVFGTVWAQVFLTNTKNPLENLREE